MSGVEHMDPIEAEARAYVEKYNGANWAGGGGMGTPFDLLVGLLAALDARDAEIARKRELADYLTSEPLGKEFEQVLHDNLPDLYVRSDAGTPPSADVVKRSDTQPSARALEYAHDGRWPDDRIDLARLCEQYACALVHDRDAAVQQYGDERAREARQEGIQIGLNGADLAVALAESEARAAAIEEAARAAKGHDAERPTYSEAAMAYVQGRLDARHDVRALVTKPDATDADKARTERDGILYREGRAAGFEEAKEICRVQGVQALFSARAFAAKPRSE